MNELATFVAVARAGSLSAGARALGLSKAAVSDQLRRLEQRLGARLMNRTTRRLSLTDAGTVCLGHGERMVQEAQAAAEAAAQLHGEPRGVLRVAAPTGLGQRRVVPAVAALQREYPSLKVELSLSAGAADLVAERFDLAVRIGSLPDSRLVARRLGMQQPAFCAAPDYLQRHGTPRTPEELAAHQILEFAPLGWRGHWRLSGRSRRQLNLQLAPAFLTDSDEALLSATRAGMGITALPEWLAGDDLASGRLVEVLPGWRTRAVPIQAVYREGAPLPAKTRVFLRHLVAQFSENTRGNP